MANNSFGSNSTTRTRNMNVFNLPTNFKTKIGNVEVLVKGQKVDENVNRYMLYIPKADSETDYSVAIATWDRSKYEVPDVRLYEAKIDPKTPKNNSSSFIRYMQNQHKTGIIAVIAEYDAWRNTQVNTVDVFEELSSADETSDFENTEDDQLAI